MVMKQIILVLVVCISSSFSSITLSCFSYPLFDLPSLGFSSESGLFANSAANVLTNVGANNKTLTADFCFFAIASVLILEVFPSLLSSQGSKILSRISPALEPGSLLPALPSLGLSKEEEEEEKDDIMPGTRRLDMDITEYEYVDTYPSPSSLSRSPGLPQTIQSMGYNDLGNLDYSGNTDTGNLDYSGAVNIGNIVQGDTSGGTVWDQIDGAHQAQVQSYGQVPSQVQGQVPSYSQVPSQVPSYGQVPNYGQVPSYGQVPVQRQVGGEAKLHSATYSVSDAWSKPMEYEDEFSWSVGGQAMVPSATSVSATVRRQVRVRAKMRWELRVG